MHVTAITDCHGVVSWKWVNESGHSKIYTNTFTTQYSNILFTLLDASLNVLDYDVCLKILNVLLMVYCVIIGNSELIGSHTLLNSENTKQTHYQIHTLHFVQRNWSFNFIST